MRFPFALLALGALPFYPVRPRPGRFPPYLRSFSTSWPRSDIAAFGAFKCDVFPEPEAVLAIFDHVKRIRYESDQTGNQFLSTFFSC